MSSLLSLGWELPNSHWYSSVWVVAPRLDSALRAPTPPFRRSSAGSSLRNPHWCSSAWIGCFSAWIGCFSAWISTSIFHYVLLTPLHPLFGASPLVWMLLIPHRHSSNSLDAPQSPLALCSIDLAIFFFILRSCNTTLPIWRSFCPW